MGKRLQAQDALEAPRNLLQSSHVALLVCRRAWKSYWSKLAGKTLGCLGRSWAPRPWRLLGSLGNAESACSEGTQLVGPGLSSPPMLAALPVMRHRLPCCSQWSWSSQVLGLW